MKKWLGIFIYCFIFSNVHAEQLIIEPDMGRAPILSAIKQTKNSIDVVMYGFTDHTFVNALLDAEKSGKNTQLLLQHYPYKNDHENIYAIDQFQKHHAPLKWSNPDFKLTHQKTFIFDNHSALVMTFNLTDSTFSRERNFALFIDDPAQVNEIRQVFNADWNYQAVKPNQTNLVWSPNNSRNKLLNFIRGAHTSLDIYAQDITDYNVIGELAKAARRGVSVRIITSEKHHNTKPNKKLAYLARAGVIIHFSKNYYIHAKVIIADHQAAMLGSMNLTKPSIDDNRELSIITSNSKTINKLEEVFGHDW